MKRKNYIRMRAGMRHVNCRYMRCRFCGYSGNFPDSGECPSCGETN